MSGAPEAVAIIGMSARMPGARTAAELWRNLREGVESVSFFSDDELVAAGVPPGDVTTPGYVKAAALLEGADQFDAAYFGCSPREAEIIDPQQRVMLEVALEAMEDAGYASDTDDRGPVGVFVGATMAHYSFNLYSQRSAGDPIDSLRMILGNAESHLATRISYKLNLKGPSMFVQSACSTSLVAVHLACRSLQDHESDLALAGGVSITVPRPAGYHHRDGGVLSPDGHCRAFDAEARGTVIGNGAGAVVLKRLSEALRDRDFVYAVIRGSAINNDGSEKVGYTAPSVFGQMAVIAEALAMAEVDPRSIGYVEAHGTGTALGDPVEVEALTRVFRTATGDCGYCALGTVKSNFGHLLAAAGVAGLLRATLALHHETIPPSLHFVRPNPGIPFAETPFDVNTHARPWRRSREPRRAGVSSFGIGGTNAHVVLEEAPLTPPTEDEAGCRVLLVSGRTDAALSAASERLAARLREGAAGSLADVCFTLQVGRRHHRLRRAIVCRTREEAIAGIERDEPPSEIRNPPVVAYMCSGQGEQRAGMGRELYRRVPSFRSAFDSCLDAFEPDVRAAVHSFLLAGGRTDAAPAADVRDTALAQPALFTFEYALARAWADAGVVPAAVAGHSMGEYVAATLAGVFALHDAARLVALRAQLMASLPSGAMLAVSLSADAVLSHLDERFSVAAVNASDRCVVAGGEAEITGLAERLRRAGAATQPLQTSHAFHSAMMDPILAPFAAAVARVPLRCPSQRLASGVTGAWLRDDQAQDPNYWVAQLRAPVQWSGAFETLAAGVDLVLEIGPTDALTRLARRRRCRAVASVAGSDADGLWPAARDLWLAGAPIRWRTLYDRPLRRVPLPTYPFEHRSYWIEERRDASPRPAPSSERKPVADWTYLPGWRRTAPPPVAKRSPMPWVVFGDNDALERRVVVRLRDRDAPVSVVRPGAEYRDCGDGTFLVDMRQAASFDRLVGALDARGLRAERWLHLWAVPRADASDIHARAFESLLSLAQALGRRPGAQHAFGIVSSGAHRVAGERLVEAGKALLVGPCRVLPQEYPGWSCVAIDVDPPVDPSDEDLDAWLAEVDERHSAIVAYRGPDRWMQVYERAPLPPADLTRLLRPRGVHLLTGGLGGVGLLVAERLARVAGARLVLMGRTALPERSEWATWQQGHASDDPVSRRLQAIQRIERAGGEVLVVAGDVTRRDDVARAIAQADARFGGIDAVWHAAGVPGGGMIQGKSSEAAAAVLAPKVIGTQILEELFAGRGLDLFVLFSSLAAVRGGFGQVDYVAANAFLDAFAQARARHPRWRRVVAIDWGAWADAGMAVDALRVRGFIPCPFWLERSVAAAEGSRHPLLGAPRTEGDATAYCVDLAPATMWTLDEHRIAGTPTLPGTAIVELLRAAAGRDAAIEIRDLAFLTPVQCATDERRQLVTSIEPCDEGLDVRIGSRTPGATHLVEHARARIHTLNAGPRAVGWAAVRARCRERVDHTRGGKRGDLVALGGRWASLVELFRGDGEAFAEVELPGAYLSDLEAYGIHPAMLDVALGAGGVAAGVDQQHLPVSYGRIRVFGRFAPRLIVHAKARPPGSGLLRVDAVVASASGEVLLEIDDYCLRAIADQIPGRSTAGAELEATLLKGAIRADEAFEVLGRVLAAAPAPQVVVSPLDLETVVAKWQGDMLAGIERADVRRPGSRREPRGGRPPANEIERRVAAVWGELLGIESVGIDDDFFASGGDSLLGIQLIARLRSLFPIELPLATMFDAPTVAAQARVVADALAARVGEDALARVEHG